MTPQKSLLRIVTTGSVDDGKSTLMGRLLFETKSILTDQFEAIQKTSKRRGLQDVDLSLLFDGLAAEREQAITIDVAYRYFETPVRKFIVADCPGHEQYTRNMVTGASNADCAIVLVDARHGVQIQSKRHAFVLSLLQVPHVVVVVNKMDAVGWSKSVYDGIVDDYLRFSRRFDVRSLTFLPVSALNGDNVSRRSRQLPWYDGPTLLQWLEGLHVAAERNLIDFRFPVQHVIRPHADFRGFAGRVASGTIRPGEDVVVLPSGRTSTVQSIDTLDGPLPEAVAGQSVVLTLADQVDVSRGCMLVRPRNRPTTSHHLDATVCWMADVPLKADASYLLKHTTQTVKAFVSRVIYRFDVDTLHRQTSDELSLNDLGRVEIRTTQPLFFDPYKLNRVTGRFILIDPVTGNTAAAGMIRGEPARADAATERSQSGARSAHTIARAPSIGRDIREARNRHKACVVWLTGLSGSGKSTIGRALEEQLHQQGCQTVLLDGDQLRQGLCGDLGFSSQDRTENIRRAGEVAKLFFDTGHVVVCTFISPIAKDRAAARSLFPEGRFVEVFVDCAVEVCIGRDPNGLYRRALGGDIKDFTGISSHYEPPGTPEVTVDSGDQTAAAAVSALLQWLVDHEIVAK
ncbi:MAG: adenylyl-sulfate kinase [Acidobacteriota bacterium]